MDGPAVFKKAVVKFPEVIVEAGKKWIWSAPRNSCQPALATGVSTLDGRLFAITLKALGFAVGLHNGLIDLALRARSVGLRYNLAMRCDCMRRLPALPISRAMVDVSPALTGVPSAHAGKASESRIGQEHGAQRKTTKGT